MLNDSSQQDMLSSYPKQLDKKKHSVTLKLVKNKHKKIQQIRKNINSK